MIVQNELHDIIQVISRRLWVILSVFTILVTTVLVGTLRQTPVYRAIATILIEQSQPQVMSFKEVAPGGPGNYQSGYREYYETQYKLMKSRSILESVAKDLNLAEDTFFKGKDVVKSLDQIVEVRPVESSQLVDISAEHSDPARAAQIADAVMEEYLRQTVERNTRVTNSAAEWLSKKIDEQRLKLKGSETALQRYRKDNNINVLPEITGEEAVEKIKTEYAQLQSLLANYNQRYTSQHPKVVELNAQIKSLANNIQGLEGMEGGGKSSEYRMLERELQSEKSIYETLLMRLKEIDLSSTLSINNISVINRAAIPKKPAKPNLPLNLLLGVFMGLCLGIGLGFLVDYLDTTIKTPMDVTHVLDTVYLGGIPTIKESDSEHRDKLVHHNPSSPISECYRIIRTEIEQSTTRDKRSKTLLLTSAEPSAGKTITVVNLGIAYAQMGSRVLLVDGDMRKPQLHSIFKIRQDKGFSDFLANTTEDVASIVKETEISNLSVVTSGNEHRYTAEILCSKRLEDFIAATKELFDVILFDSPPVAIVTDGMILADKVDAVMQIIRSRKTMVSVAQRIVVQMSRIKARYLGVILNDVRFINNGHYRY